MTSSSATQFSEPLQCLFLPKRYKILYGGRGAGRSWGVARYLLLTGAKQPIRVLCARELQKSISESVHQLLEDQIHSLGLEDHYIIQRDAILGVRHPTKFSFEGIKNNVNKIKSYEGVEYCWVEEANKVSKRSWKTLIPTIRKPGSEIIITFNPELEEDYTFQRFVKELKLEAKQHTEGNGYSIDTSPSAFIVYMNWKSNPWFRATESYDEMLRDARLDPDDYLNIWEGQCLQQLEGAVYANEMRKLTLDNRVMRVPYDPSALVHTYWDLGRHDATAIWFAQRVGMEWRVIDYYENSFVGDISHYVKYIKSLDYSHGTAYLPHDAKAKRLGMSYSIEAQIRKHGLDTHIVPKVSVLDGINAARLLLRQCYIDEDKCTDGLKALRHYRYKVIDGQTSREPDHDSKEAGWASHGADAFRYMAVMAGSAKESGPGRAARVVDRIKESLAGGLFTEGSPKASSLDWMG